VRHWFSEPARKGAIIVPSQQREIHSSTLKVAGGKLHYEVEGSGPLLMTIPGGPADAGIFAGLAAALADRYTVVRYDPRGNSRSVLDGPPQDQDMDVHGDDAAQLLAVFGSEPAYVLGSSGGAQIGLNLAARHPGSVRTLVAHEPPCIRLLADAAVRISNDEIYETYRSSGAGAAMQVFLARTGLDGGPKPESVMPPSPEAQESFARMRGNLDFFFAHGFKPISLFVPDVEALISGAPRIIVGVGDVSAGQLAYRTAIALAERLGTAPAVFPGGHTGFTEQPAEFADKLHEVLSK
jgi:pimeloyl-ACP methyl ester carboxylesterase